MNVAWLGCWLVLARRGIRIGAGHGQQTIGEVYTHQPSLNIKEAAMQWKKPEFSDLRFGFEITMYIANR
jgi:pyrroloquinoline quinone biosynthesis protein A